MEHLPRAFSFCLLILTTNLWGVVRFEPLVGITFAGSEEFTLSSSKAPFDRSGIQYGAKLGTSISHTLLVGLDCRLGEVDVNVTAQTPAGISNAKYETFALGVFLDYNMFSSFKIWGTYYFRNEQDATNDSGPLGNTTFSGNKFSFGAGYSNLPYLGRYVSLNIEYSFFELDTVELTNNMIVRLPSSLLDYDSTVKGSEFIVSISFPFNISK